MLAYYNNNAGALFQLYQSLDPEQLHKGWKRHLPAGGGLALDVGSGSGRDAVWLVQKGFRVVAVEPAAQLRALGKRATSAYSNISWFDDSLPSLSLLVKKRYRYTFILVGGVLMHLSATERSRSFDTLTRLMATKSFMVITLRHGADNQARKFHNVFADEIVQLARQKTLRYETLPVEQDQLAREGVSWQVVLLWN